MGSGCDGEECRAIISYTNKCLQEAKERGEYVDIHDIGGVDPEDYDVWISDVNHEKLRGEVAETVGIPYHAMATAEDSNKVVEIGDWYMYGQKFRTIFPAVVARGNQAHWVFFLIDSGPPLTYPSAQVSAPSCEKEAWLLTTLDGDLFDITAKFVPALVKIAGYHQAVNRSPIHSGFTETNILGMGFCNLYCVSQWNDLTRARAKLIFGTDWEMPVEKSKKL